MYARGMSQTSIRVETVSRDALARVAAERNETLDQALRRLVWEHEARESRARLDADPEAAAEYDAETDRLGGAATEVSE
jgi:hypothetical protein